MLEMYSQLRVTLKMLIARPTCAWIGNLQQFACRRLASCWTDVSRLYFCSYITTTTHITSFTTVAMSITAIINLSLMVTTNEGVGLGFAAACNVISPVFSGTLLGLLTGALESSPEIYGKWFSILASLYIIEPILTRTYIKTLCTLAEKVMVPHVHARLCLLAMIVMPDFLYALSVVFNHPIGPHSQVTHMWFSW